MPITFQIDSATNPDEITEFGDAAAQDISTSATITLTDPADGLPIAFSVGDGATATVDGGALPSGDTIDVSGLISSDAISFDSLDANGGQQTINWHYDPSAANLDWLREGQVLTITYTAQASDPGATSNTQDLVITISGTNDAPTIDEATNPDSIAEVTGDSSGQDITSVSGTIEVSDKDVGDTLTLSVTGAGTAALNGGDLPTDASVDVSNLVSQLAVTFDAATSDGAQQTIDWHYDPTTTNLDWLGANDTLTITYTAQVDDGQGNVGSQPLTITITGTNDDPVFSGDPVTVGPNESLTEAADQTGQTTPALAANDDLSFTDVDLSDEHTSSDSLVSAVWAEAGSKDVPQATLDAIAADATFTTTVSDDSTGDGAGTVHWAFSLDDKYADFLAAGETLTLTYDVTVDDGNEGTDTQSVSVVITGANDTPDAVDDVKDVTEDASSVIVPKVVEDTVLGNDTDPDLNDMLTVVAVAAGDNTLSESDVGNEITGTYGKLTLNSDGSYSYSFLNTDAAIAGETIQDVFHYKISDGNGGYDEATLTINIAGTDLDLTITPPPADPHDANPFIAQRGDDIVRGTGLADTIYGRDGNDQLSGSSGNDTLYGEKGDDQLSGGSDNDLLSGGEGNDVLRGGDGNDTLVGGTGLDVYDGGNDTDTADYSDTTAGVTVDLTPLDRSAQTVDATTIGALLVAAGYGASHLAGWAYGSEIDTDVIFNVENVIGGSGNDSITGDDNANAIYGGLGNDVIHGAGGADTLEGDAGNDFVDGGAGNDTIVAGLNTGAGYDVYDGGADTDTVDYSSTTSGVTVFLDAANRSADLVTSPDGAGGNPDTIGEMLTGAGLGPTTPVGRADGAEIGTDALLNIENVTGGAGDDIIHGNANANVIYANGGADQVWGEGGDDTIYGGDGNDVIVGGHGGDSNLPSGNDTIYGGAGDDQIWGEDGNDILWGGAGADQYAGGAGNDTLYFEGDGTSDTAWGGADSDTFVFQPGFGVDTLKDFLAYGNGSDKIDLTAFAGASFAGLTILQVGKNVEITGFGPGNKIILEVVSAGAITADDFIFASGGGPGITIPGTAGNDPNLTGTNGNDTINGQGGNDFLYGLGGNDSLNGGAGNDFLEGGAGGDTMVGGAGDDTYVVDSTFDILTEGSSAGTDTVQSFITFTLGTNFENLTLVGPSDINGTGNTVANVINGNSGANLLMGLGGNDTLNGGDGNDTLNGGVGNDHMAGGAGDDIYIVDSTSDVLTETSSADGTDTVQSSVTWTLGTNFENLLLLGSANINGTGNSAANVISGNRGNNVLNGAGGIDTLSYETATAGVKVSLAITSAQATGGAGSDTISNFENLTGSSFNDTLTGSSIANVIEGGAGLDTLTGGAGADAFVFKSAVLGLDTITDFLSGTDWLQISTTGFGGGLSVGVSPTLATVTDIAGYVGGATGHFLFDNSGTNSGTVYWDPTGGSSSDAIAFAKINGTTFTAADLHLV